MDEFPLPRRGPRQRTLRARHDRRPTRIDRPEPGAAVLACRCGEVLAMADMRRAAVPAPRSGPSIAPIRCTGCAGAP